MFDIFQSGLSCDCEDALKKVRNAILEGISETWSHLEANVCINSSTEQTSESCNMNAGLMHGLR